MHYGQNDTAIAELDGPFDFPIRDPLDTTLSWRRYNPERKYYDEFRRWELAIDHLKTVPHTVHRIEKHPVLEGSTGEHWTKTAVKERDLKALKELPEVRYLLEWIEQPKIGGFFKEHYPEGFWWLNTTNPSN